MDALARFEDTLEEALEGSFTRVFRTRLQPVELARRLARAMDRERAVGPGEVWSPNQYQVRVSPSDYAGLASFRQALETRLADFLGAHARERDLCLLAPPVVTLVADATVSDGRPQVTAELADLPAAPAGEPDPSLAAGYTAKVPIRRFSRLPVLVARSDNRSYGLDHSPVTIGRALDNDIILDDRRVSRHHARITISGQTIQITDLGSANGTAVNGLPVTNSHLEDGDTVSVGGLELRLRRPPQ